MDDASPRAVDARLLRDDWHSLAADEAMAVHGADERGLTAVAAEQRLSLYGANELAAAQTTPAWRRFLNQFNDPLIMLLICAAVLAASLGHPIDATVIALVLLINAIVGFVQEGRAEQALAALRSMLAPTARVIRAGHRIAVPVGQLVPGDVVVLEAGDRVPADARLLRSRGLRVDESVLTGESVAADKSPSATARDVPLGERSSMVHSGTLVVSGQATALVVATGAASQVGRIGELLGGIDALTTPLLRKVAQFSRRFAALAVVAALALYAYAVLVRDYAWLDALMIVVALAVGVVPESLPAVITITLALGVRRMARRHAIVRRLPAVETLGATTVICTDKTGTLTRNEMTVRRVVTAAGAVDVGGDGYAAEGALAAVGDDAATLAQARRLARIGALCNDARLREQDGRWAVDGDPMEGALLALAGKAGLDLATLREQRPRLDEVPFDAEHRLMASLHAAASGEAVMLVKGAPERLLALSRAQIAAHGDEAALDDAYWRQAIAEAAGQGQRVLGFAMRRLPVPLAVFMLSDVADLVFVGIAGFVDPPRAEAIEAVADCRRAGIEVKMITGDHGATAAAIARQIGLAADPVVVTGDELDALAADQWHDVAARANVFARASPEHKLRIVQALQARGHIVAMTGDGVNDAPSLKQADIGVAMGHKGTEAAKEASQMVLADDNFASIAAAVHEGRAVYDNIVKVVAWTIPTNGGEVLAVSAAILFGLALPMTAPQILWINMVLTVTLGLSLAFEPPERDIMSRPPRRRDAPLVSPFMLWRIALVSLLFTIGAFGIYRWGLSRGLGEAAARTLVVNQFCVMEIFYLFSVRYLHEGSFHLRGVRGTPAVLGAIAAVVVAQAAFTYLPFMHRMFDSRPVGALEIAVMIGIGLAIMVVLEIEKAILRRIGLFDELRR